MMIANGVWRVDWRATSAADVGGGMGRARREMIEVIWGVRDGLA